MSVKHLLNSVTSENIPKNYACVQLIVKIRLLPLCKEVNIYINNITTALLLLFDSTVYSGLLLGSKSHLLECHQI